MNKSQCKIKINKQIFLKVKNKETNEISFFSFNKLITYLSGNQKI